MTKRNLFRAGIVLGAVLGAIIAWSMAEKTRKTAKAYEELLARNAPLAARARKELELYYEMHPNETRTPPGVNPFTEILDEERKKRDAVLNPREAEAARRLSV